MTEPLQQTLADYQARLDRIEKEIAVQGDQVRPDLISERDSLQAEISRLQAQSTAEPSSQPVSVANQPSPVSQTFREQVQPPNVAQTDVTSAASMDYRSGQTLDDLKLSASGSVADPVGQTFQPPPASAAEKIGQSEHPAQSQTETRPDEPERSRGEAGNAHLARLSSASREAFAIAAAVGQRVRQPNITTKTLLIGLNQKERGATYALLTAFDQPPDQFLGWIAQHEGWRLTPQIMADVLVRAANIEINNYPYSNNVGRVLERAAQVADAHHSNPIRRRHLLTGLLAVGLDESDVSLRPSAYKLLEEMGIPTEQIRDILAAMPEGTRIVPDMFIAYSARSAFADTAVEQDRLGFESYAQALAEIIVKPETNPPVVIGVYGPWGSGKSTFMELVKKHLDNWDKRHHPDESLPVWQRTIKHLPGWRWVVKHLSHWLQALNRLPRWPWVLKYLSRWLQALKPLFDSESIPGPAGPPPRVVCVKYNAWAYTDAEKLWAGLIQKISSCLDEQIPLLRKPLFWLGRSFWRFVGAVLLGFLPLVIGLGVSLGLLLWAQVQQWELGATIASQLIPILLALAGSYGALTNQKPLTEVVGSLIKQYDPTELEGITNQIQEEVKKTIKDNFLLPSEAEQLKQNDVGATSRLDTKKLRQKKLKVVIMIDELDRCPLEKIIDILEAIKIFLAEEIFIVLLAVDTRVVAEAIRLRYKDADNLNLAREYLEKIIQIPIPVPKANSQQLTRFVSGLMPLVEDETTDQQVEAASQPSHATATIEASPSAGQTPPVIPKNLDNKNQLSDTAGERKCLTHFAVHFLQSNPRRVKRLLNTYRYVKILAHRNREQTGQPEWQEKMINWLGFTMCWPLFMSQVIQVKRWPAASGPGQIRMDHFFKDIPEDEWPPAEALKLELPIDDEISRFEILAGNFMIESPPRTITSDQANKRRKGGGNDQSVAKVSGDQKRKQKEQQ